MKLPNFIEKHCRWLRISHLSIILVAVYFVFTTLAFTNLIDRSYLTLSSKDILENNEFWRLLSFNFLLNTNNSPFLFIILLYMQWFFGSTLEKTIGEIKFTLLFLLTAIVPIILVFIFPEEYVSVTVFPVVTFISFGIFYPDYILLLFFILPIKTKWLSRFSILGVLGLVFYDKFSHTSIILLLSTMVPYLLFFADDIYIRYKFKSKKVYIISNKQLLKQQHHHQCKVCYKTDKTSPNLDFRYVEKNGQLECYCSEHYPMPKNC